MGVFMLFCLLYLYVFLFVYTFVGTNGKEENTPLDKNSLEEITLGDLSAIDEQENSEEENG